MLHACVQKFDVTENLEIFLGTKQGLNVSFSFNFPALSVFENPAGRYGFPIERPDK